MNRMKTPGRAKRSSAVGTPGPSHSEKGGAPRFEYKGKSYKAMTELLRAIMDSHPNQPDEYYQTIFEKNFELTSAQFRRAMAQVRPKRPKVAKGTTPIRPSSKRKSSSSSESDAGDTNGSSSATPLPSKKVESGSSPLAESTAYVVSDAEEPGERIRKANYVIEKPQSTQMTYETVAGAEELVGAPSKKVVPLQKLESLEVRGWSKESPTRTVTPEVDEGFSPPTFQIHLAERSNNNQVQSEDTVKEDDLKKDSQQQQKDSSESGVEQQEEAAAAAIVVATKVVEVEDDEEPHEKDYKEEEEDDDIMELDQDGQSVVKQADRLNSSNSNRDKIEAAMMEAVEEQGSTVPNTVLLQSARQSSMEEAAAEAAAVTTAIATATATQTEPITGPANCQYNGDTASQDQPSAVMAAGGEYPGQAFLGSAVAETHYPSINYYQATLNAAAPPVAGGNDVAGAGKVWTPPVMSGNLNGAAGENRADSKPKKALPKCLMNIPAKVEFLGRDGARSEVGKMVFNEKGFFAFTKDGKNVHSLPRSGDAIPPFQARLGLKDLHISCGNQGEKK